MEEFKRRYGTEYEAVPRPEDELEEELREGYEFDPDPHFEHFLLDNRPELTEPEKSVVRVQKNKEDSMLVYEQELARWWETRKEGDRGVIWLWFFIGCCPTMLICAASGAFCGFVCTEQI